MARLLLFAGAREAAGVREADLPGTSLEEVLDAACARFGTTFTRVLAASRVWVNGSPALPEAPLGPADEVAVIPPVSGG